MALLALAGIAAVGAVAFQSGVCVGRMTGYERGRDDGGKYWSKKYALLVGKMNVALGSLTIGEIAEALKAPTTDKVYALLNRLGQKADRAVLDAKARVAEFTA